MNEPLINVSANIHVSLRDILNSMSDEHKEMIIDYLENTGYIVYEVGTNLDDILSVFDPTDIQNYLEDKINCALVPESPTMIDFNTVDSDRVYELIGELIDKGVISFEMLIGRVTLARFNKATKNIIK